MRLFKRNERRDEERLAWHFLEGFVSSFCQPNGRWSTTIYPSGESMRTQNEIWRIGGYLGQLLNGGPIPGYVQNGELMQWLRDNLPTLIVETPQENKEPDVEGQCNNRWASNRCTRELLHEGTHGIDLGNGIILCPWPAKITVAETKGGSCKQQKI